MINHFRTLLLNQDGVGFAGYPGEEYTPPGYRHVLLPGFLESIRQILFGRNPDQTMLDFRAKQLLVCLHATELTEYVFSFDSRFTYQLGDTDLFLSPFVPQIRPLAGTLAELRLVGSLEPPDVTGRSGHLWEVTVLDSDTVRIQRWTPPLLDTQESYELQGGMSRLLPLAGSELKFHFVYESGGRWEIQATARPRWGLGELIAALESLESTAIYRLFGVGSGKMRREPFRTFYNLWQDHPQAAYRLGGLLLALGYRTEEIRQGGLVD